MSLGGFGPEAERFRDLDDAALREAQAVFCVNCRAEGPDGRVRLCALHASTEAKSAEIERLTQARDTALEALERERSARRGMA